MYHASEAAAKNWPGEPETDPTSEEPVQVPGERIEPAECMDIAYRGVLRDSSVKGGVSCNPRSSVNVTTPNPNCQVQVRPA